jgi:hypothetical protein
MDVTLSGITTSHYQFFSSDILMIMSFFSASGLAAAGQCRVRLELSYLLVGALFERNQFLNQKPINVIDCKLNIK